MKKYFEHFGKNLWSLGLGGESMSPDYFLVFLGLFLNLEDLTVNERVEGSGTSRVLAVSPKLSGRLTARTHTTTLLQAPCKPPPMISFHEHQHDYQELIDACAKTLVGLRAMFVGHGK